MKQITDFPNLPLGLLPTPLYRLENLSRELGRNLYIKRDDLMGVALGGNKVRKLEFLLADARSKGADVVLTVLLPAEDAADFQTQVTDLSSGAVEVLEEDRRFQPGPP